MTNALMTVDVDAEAVLAALARVGDAAATHVKAAALVTAKNIVREAQARVARRTGETSRGIHLEETHDGQGYVVKPSFELRAISLHTSKKTGRIHTQAVTQNNLPIWLEFGTKSMTARPYFFASADLERGPHDRRMAEAVQAAVDETGLGD